MASWGIPGLVTTQKPISISNRIGEIARQLLLTARRIPFCKVEDGQWCPDAQELGG
jgi:hypothetical protein